MPTVIDEFIVTMGLDVRSFREGQKQAAADFKKTEEEAVKRANNIEDAGKKAAAFYTRLRTEVIALFAAIAVGTGFANFVRNIVNTEAEVGKLSKAMGISTETLTAWQGASKRVGGSAEATAGTFQSLTREFQNFALTGQSSVLPYFRFLQVAVTDTAGKIRPLEEIFLDLSEKFSKMDPRRAHALGANMGIDPGMMALLIKGPAAVRGLLEEQRKLGLTTMADAEAGQRLLNMIENIQQAVRRLGQAILTALGPQIEAVLGQMERWLITNRAWLEEKFIEGIQTLGEHIRQLGAFLKGVDWDGAKKGIQDFLAKVDEVVKSLGGWVRVGEVLFAAWAVSQLGLIAAGVGAIGLALSNPVVLAALAAWTTYYAMASKFEAPKTQEEFDARMRGWGPESPNWAGIPREQQFKYPNSPASRGGADSPSQKLLPWLFPPNDRSVADTSMSKYQQGFLEALSEPESEGSYTIRNGGSHITDFSAHPGPGFGPKGKSSAAGRYQFTYETWQEIAAELGLKDFTPASQDRAAWHLAQKEYRKQTGRDLGADLQEGGHEARISFALNRRWPSLPGGSQQLRNSMQWFQSLRKRTEAAGAPKAPVTSPSASPSGNAPDSWGGGGAMEPSATSYRTSETNVNVGTVTIHTAATDANGIAGSFEQALQQRAFVNQANTGLT